MSLAGMALGNWKSGGFRNSDGGKCLKIHTEEIE